MKNSKTILTLKTIHDLLSSADITWILLGSTSLKIQNIEVRLNPDIDILVSKDDIYLVDKVLKEYRTRDLERSSTSKYKSYYATYDINNTNIDLIAEFQYRKRDNTWSKPVPIDKYNSVEFEGMQLKLLPLEEELKEYYETGRTDKYNKIKSMLDSY